MGILLQESIEPCRTHIVFQFDKEKVDSVVDDIVKRIGKEHTIKGFRKGKASANSIKIAARKSILEEAKQKLVNEAYQDILHDTELKPFGNPEVNKIDISFSSFTMDMKLAYMPKFELAQYKGLELQEPTGLPALDELVEQTKESLCKEHMLLRPFGDDDFLMDGDIAVVGYKSFIDNSEFPNSAADGVVINLGEGKFLRDFEVNVMGMKVGEQREFDVVFPDSTNNENAKSLAGKSVHFVVDLTSATRRDPSEFNEKLAETMSVSFDELVAKVNDHAKLQLDQIRKMHLKKMIFDILIENNKIEVPEWMQVQAAKYISSTHGLKWEQNDNSVKEHFITEATRTLKLSLIFDMIRDVEPETALAPDEIQKILLNNIGHLPKDVQLNLFSKNNTSTLSNLYSEIQDEQVFEWIIKNSNLGSDDKKDTKEQQNGTQEEGC